MNTTQVEPSNVNLIFLLLVAALDLAGVFFNIRMVRSCFKDKTKYTFLQKCRPLTVFQCACQVTILVTNAVQSWKLLLDIPPRESCDIFRALTISVMFFMAGNLVILMNHSYHLTDCENCRPFFKSKVLGAVSLALTGSAIIWFSCLSPEFLSQMEVKGILYVVMVAFVVLLLVENSMNHNLHDQLEKTNARTSMKTCALLWKVCKENKMCMLFIVMLVMCLAVILIGLPRSSFSIDFEQAKFFHEVVYSLITRFVVGIVLPLTISDLIKGSYIEETERTMLVV